RLSYVAAVERGRTQQLPRSLDAVARHADELPARWLQPASQDDVLADRIQRARRSGPAAPRQQSAWLGPVQSRRPDAALRTWVRSGQAGVHLRCERSLRLQQLGTCGVS